MFGCLFVRNLKPPRGGTVWTSKPQGENWWTTRMSCFSTFYTPSKTISWLTKCCMTQLPSFFNCRSTFSYQRRDILMDRFMERRFKPSRENFGGCPPGIDPVTFCFQGGSDELPGQYWWWPSTVKPRFFSAASFFSGLRRVVLVKKGVPTYEGR